MLHQYVWIIRFDCIELVMNFDALLVIIYAHSVYYYFVTL